MKKLFIPAILAILAIGCQKAQQKSTFEWETKFEKTQGTETVTYEEGIQYLETLALYHPELKLQTIGKTDSGEPLHLALLSADQTFDFDQIQNKSILLINNAIHPGEPDGVDASLMLLRDILQDKERLASLEDVVIAVIPFYNIGGAKNRNSHSRANQVGPKSYGFRGNAQNLDLNRDFIKADSENMKSFTQIFHSLNPDLFIDTHVSNGADYQYVMTYLSTQEDKLGGKLGDYMRNQLTPSMEKKMSAKGFDMTPYVNVWGTVPDSGYVQFIDTPRYSSGYTTLFNTLSYVTETHMLKPFKTRTEATYAFLDEAIDYLKNNGKEVKALRKETEEAVKMQKTFPIAWKANKLEFEVRKFKGYEGGYKISDVSRLPRLYYDRNKPFEKDIKFYNQYVADKSVQKPFAYIIPAGHQKVVDLLKLNNIKVTQIHDSKTVNASVYYIADYKTTSAPYEGHYLHYNVEVNSKPQEVTINAGDYIVEVNQSANRYIVETLEPHATDSFFAWNFFDAILQQKEHFSPYVFEDHAAKYLEEHPEIREALEAKKKEDKEFADNAYAQLVFIYKQTPHYEKAHLRYPIMRLEQAPDFL
ncbi:M14 family metallopeptidase [Limibacter armeniacum]|uniref:M14 family metallopeptidase n=1 Tax=Limibacter armeniacum TaxID=466084 RepID=UPI002FE63259